MPRLLVRPDAPRPRVRTPALGPGAGARFAPVGALRFAP